MHQVFSNIVSPFYRRAADFEAAETNERGLILLDNQFRLLREGLLGELRSEFQIATGQKKGKRKTLLSNLQFAGIDCGTPSKGKACLLKLRCLDDIPQLRRIDDGPSRRNFVKETRNKNIMKHQSLGCLVSKGSLVAFASVERDEEMLAQKSAIIILGISDEASFKSTLLTCKIGVDLQFVQVDTAVFAYEPILKCLQTITDLPLEDQLFGDASETGEVFSDIEPSDIVDNISKDRQADLKDLIGASRPVHLDAARTESLISGLTKKVSLIQGPSGKSFH